MIYNLEFTEIALQDMALLKKQKLKLTVNSSYC